MKLFNIPKIFFNGFSPFIIILLFPAIQLNTLFCQSKSGNEFLSPSNRLKFGESLYKEKDYLRAADEFKEYLKVNNNDSVQFKFASSFFKMGRFTEAADNFKDIFFSLSLSEEARLMFYESGFFKNDFKNFRNQVESGSYKVTKYRNAIERLKFASYFFDDDVLPDENIFLEPFPDSAQSKLSQFYFQKKYPKHRSPATAAILSVLIPGAGKIYTGEIGDGITAFVATALSAYLAYTNFKADHKFRGWLFTGLTGFFYGGGIYGSAASAQIYNARISFNFVNEVKFYFEKSNYFLPKSDL